VTNLVAGDDRHQRCSWGTSAPDYIAYHDTEWGFGVVDDHRLFEKLCLEGFQSGLSWLTILRKRENFRTAFAGFDPRLVAGFDETDVDRLLADAGIIRHQGKIRSTINNASRALEMIDEFGSIANFMWPYATFDGPPTEVLALTPTSTAISKDLKKRGWTFVGPTTMYAFMQAMGLVNDHAEGCWVRQRSEQARRKAYRAHGKAKPEEANKESDDR
jgi:DNA-3-methyladenine glycosylase I